MVSAIGEMDLSFPRVGHKLGCLGCRQLLTGWEAMEKVSDAVGGNFRMVKNTQHGDLWIMSEEDGARPTERPAVDPIHIKPEGSDDRRRACVSGEGWAARDVRQGSREVLQMEVEILPVCCVHTPAEAGTDTGVGGGGGANGLQVGGSGILTGMGDGDTASVHLVGKVKPVCGKTAISKLEKIRWKVVVGGESGDCWER